MSSSELVPRLLEEHHESLISQLLHQFEHGGMPHTLLLAEHEWRDAVKRINVLLGHFLGETGAEPTTLHCAHNGAMFSRVKTIFEPYSDKIHSYESLLHLLKIYRRSCTTLLHEHASSLNGYFHHALEMTHHFFDRFELHSFTHLESTKPSYTPIRWEKRYESLLSGSGEGIMITDSQRRILDINHVFQTITGYTSNEVLGQTPKILKSGQHDDLFYAQMWEALDQEGTWSGEIYNKKKNGDIYLENLRINVIYDQDGRVENYVAHFSDQSDMEDSKRQLNYLSRFDPLTGLANEELFKVRMKRAIARSESNNRRFSILFIDLDNFNVINNTYGHSFGDRVLQEVANRLKPLIRLNDTISRYGGDEFMVLLEDYTTGASIEKIGKSILDAIATPIYIDKNEFILTASLGISIFPLDGTNSESLIKHAHVATYQAKQHGKNMAMFYNRSMTEDVKEKLALTHDMHHALKNREFELYYQPLVNLLTQEVEAVEALIRWNHPTRGMVSPNDFIPLAEETYQIIEIGDWVLNRACEQLKIWEDTGVFHGAISVNISGIQLSREGFDEKVEAVLSRTGISAKKLELEITETQVMDHLTQVVNVLERIKKMGVRISIDDFGTGYSSLAHLRALPINKLKIDRQFIKELQHSSDDQEISKAIIAMAKALNLNVLAEGIEEQEQLFYLLAQGCEMGQGYHFSEPLSEDSFLSWMQER